MAPVQKWIPNKGIHFFLFFFFPLISIAETRTRSSSAQIGVGTGPDSVRSRRLDLKLGLNQEWQMRLSGQQVVDTTKNQDNTASLGANWRSDSTDYFGQALVVRNTPDSDTVITKIPLSLGWITLDEDNYMLTLSPTRYLDIPSSDQATLTEIKFSGEWLLGEEATVSGKLGASHLKDQNKLAESYGAVKSSAGLGFSYELYDWLSGEIFYTHTNYFDQKSSGITDFGISLMLAEKVNLDISASSDNFYELSVSCYF